MSHAGRYLELDGYDWIALPWEGDAFRSVASFVSMVTVQP
jgi:hypothetical protein